MENEVVVKICQSLEQLKDNALHLPKRIVELNTQILQICILFSMCFSVCMYVCMYVYMYDCIYVCMCVCVYAYMCVCVCVCVCVPVPLRKETACFPADLPGPAHSNP